MKLSIKVINLLKKESGTELRLPSDIEILALDLEKKTGEHIGVNTLKRLLGFINDERMPRTSTLDIIAQYLGYSNWEVLEQLDSGSNSDFGDIEGSMTSDSLSVGQTILVVYQPNRQVKMKYLGNNRFEVTMSVNSKLRAGDTLEITNLVTGYPLIASHVVRNGIDLGTFTAGKEKGIQFKLIEP